MATSSNQTTLTQTTVDSVDTHKCNCCRKVKSVEDCYELNKCGTHYKTCDKCRARHPCGLCEYSCSYPSDLKAHVNNVHNKIKKFACPKCIYTSTKKGYLDRHMRACRNVKVGVAIRKCEEVLECMGVDSSAGHMFKKSPLLFDLHIPSLDVVVEFSDISH